MTTRELPVAEWSRLEGTELGAVRDQLRPGCTRVLVVENEQGRIVACWAALVMVHAEGLWIDPAYRKKATVARRLWVGFRQLVESLGANSVLTAGVDPDVCGLLAKRGTKCPGELYALPLGGK